VHGDCNTRKRERGREEYHRQLLLFQAAVLPHLLDLTVLDKSLDDDVEAVRIRAKTEVDHAGKELQGLGDRIVVEKFSSR